MPLSKDYISQKICENGHKVIKIQEEMATGPHKSRPTLLGTCSIGQIWTGEEVRKAAIQQRQ